MDSERKWLARAENRNLTLKEYKNPTYHTDLQKKIKEHFYAGYKKQTGSYFQHTTTLSENK